MACSVLSTGPESFNFLPESYALPLERREALEEEDNSVLGLVHLDLAKYHETCRLATKS